MKTSRHSQRRRTTTSQRLFESIARHGVVWRPTILWVAFCCALPAHAQTKTTSETPTAPPRVAPEEVAALKKEELGVVQKLARDFPNSLEPIVLTGRVHYRHGRADEAMAIWKRVLERDPKRPRVHEDMGWFAMSKGQYEQAIEHWRQVLEIRPGAPGIHSGIARALMGSNRHAEAVDALKKEIEISPNSSFDWFLLGQEHRQQKQHEQAKAAYEKAIALDPNLTNAYYGLFTVCGRLGQRDEAKQHMATFKKLKAADMERLKDRNEAFNDLIDMRRNAAETLMFAGQAYLSAGRVDEAERLIIRATQLAPKNATYHLHAAAIAMQLKHPARAEKAFREVIRLAPENARGYSGLAHLYLQANQRLPLAKQLAQKAVALEPSAFHYYVLSWACGRNGDDAGAATAISRAVQLEPGNPRYRRIAEALKIRN